MLDDWFALHFFQRWHSQLLGTDIPKFGEPIQNQTIAVGREAVFSCVVDNLQTYKVSKKFLITLQGNCH